MAINTGDHLIEAKITVTKGEKFWTLKTDHLIQGNHLVWCCQIQVKLYSISRNIQVLTSKSRGLGLRPNQVTMFMRTKPLSTQEFRWILAYSLRNLIKCRGTFTLTNICTKGTLRNFMPRKPGHAAGLDCSLYLDTVHVT